MGLTVPTKHLMTMEAIVHPYILLMMSIFNEQETKNIITSILHVETIIIKIIVEILIISSTSITIVVIVVITVCSKRVENHLHRRATDVSTSTTSSTAEGEAKVEVVEEEVQEASIKNTITLRNISPSLKMKNKH